MPRQSPVSAFDPKRTFSALPIFAGQYGFATMD